MSATTDTQLSPDQVKRIELNRLKAKAKQRQKEAAASSSSKPSDTLNTNGKRPLGVVSSTSASPTTVKPLKRDSRLGTYFDYDLSKMVNSKGGFLVEDDTESFEQLKTKERERERERAQQNVEPPMYLDRSMNPKCRECDSQDINQTYRKVFKVLVCKTCEQSMPEKYSLLTKTEVREDYLLTDSELRDSEEMPHLLKANPHKSTYHNMMLFLRCQVEEFAWKKWGTPKALDAEFERRQADKKKRKTKKFEQGLADLRRRTREGIWQKRQDAEHKHVFGATEEGDDGAGRQVCHVCGFTIEVEEL